MRESNLHLVLNSGIEPEFNFFFFLWGESNLFILVLLVMDRKMGTFWKTLFRMAPIWFRLNRFIFPVGNRTLKVYVVMVKGVVEDNNVKFMQFWDGSQYMFKRL